jgi:hypothetical protein
MTADKQKINLAAFNVGDKMIQTVIVDGI